MKIETSVTVTNTLGTFAKGIPQRLGQVVRKAAFDVVASAQGHSDVDTGALRAGWYAETNRTSTYDQAVEAAREANADVVIVAEAPRPEPLEAIVANATAHAIHKEYGTVHMSASPMLHPAADEVRPGFEAAVAAVMQSNG